MFRPSARRKNALWGWMLVYICIRLQTKQWCSSKPLSLPPQILVLKSDKGVLKLIPLHWLPFLSAMFCVCMKVERESLSTSMVYYSSWSV